MSLVLADADRIPDATKTRVRTSMTELGYVYNRAAAAARVGQSSLIGLVLTDIHNPFFAEVTMGIDRAVAERGLSVVQGYSLGEPGREVAITQSLAEHLLAGLILLPTALSDAERLRPLAAGQPLVQLLRQVQGLDSDFVGVDNVTSGLLLGEHLASRGFRDVTLVGGVASPQLTERSRGLAVALGRPVTEVLGGADGFRAHLERGIPRCVVTYNDAHLLAVLHALRDRGLRPGVDVAVASFDNTRLAADAFPGITSMDHHPGRLASAAVRLVLARAEEPGRPLERVMVPPELVVRESTAGTA